MSVLPESSIDLNHVSTASMPSLTWSINLSTGRIDGYADGLAAVKQAVGIILSTERFEHQIYKSASGFETTDLIGKDSGFVAAELRTRIEDALKQDDRITGISDYTFAADGDTVTASFTVDTVYGSLASEVTV